MKLWLKFEQKVSYTGKCYLTSNKSHWFTINLGVSHYDIQQISSVSTTRNTYLQTVVYNGDLQKKMSL